MSLAGMLLSLALSAPAARAALAQQARPVVGGVVRSREWVIRRSPRREEEFIGEVSYHKGPSALSSDWALFRHDEQIWQARGHVRVRHVLESGDRIEASGEVSEFDQKTEQGHLLGAPGGLVSFRRFPTSEGGTDEGSAVRLDWHGQATARLSGQVKLWGPRLELWGDRADYDDAAGTVTVVGSRPVVRLLQGDWTGAVQGDTVTAREKPESLWADGKTRGWLRFKDKLEKLAK